MEEALSRTTKLMESENYKDRFIAEYWQTKIRYEKLKNFNNTIEAVRLNNNLGGTQLIEPVHDCPLEMLKEQQRIMGEYLHVLELRAILEEVKLNEVVL